MFYLYFLYLVVFSGLMYYFRYKIFLMLLGLVIKVWKWKIDFHQKYNKRARPFVMEKINDNNMFIEYNVLWDGKEHKIVFVDKLDINEDILQFRKDPGKYFVNKSNIVFCGIMDHNGDILFDSTDDIRKFCFYFDKQKSLSVFIHYLQEKICKTIKKDADIYRNNFTVYMNDESFSEKTFLVKDLLYKDFCEVFSK